MLIDDSFGIRWHFRVNLMAEAVDSRSPIQSVTIHGEEHQYHPDFVVVMDDGRGPLDPLYLIVEVSGEKKKEKAAKVMTARTLWIPAVNNHGAFGRWGFLEVMDPYDVLELIRSVTSGTAV